MRRNGLRNRPGYIAAGIVMSTVLFAGAAAPVQVMAQDVESEGVGSGTDLVSIDFDDGETDGFTIYTNGGSCEIANTDGMLDVLITNCGSLDYANQVYWDGFALDQNCVYTYSFDISSDIERQVEYRLQLNGGDYHAYQGEWLDVGPEVLHFSVDWTMQEDSDPAPRIVFNMGRTDDMTEDPGEHHVYIDNIRLTIRDDSDAVHTEALPEYPEVVLSQIGYRPEDCKTVIVKEDSEEGAFYVINEETGDTVYEGSFEKAMYDKASGTRIKRGDFSSFREEGNYHILVESGDLKEESYSFRIAADVYGQLYRDVVRMLYLQRCGTELSGEDAGIYAHPACHTGEALVYGSDRMKDVSGGWHDAGDYGRYVVSGAKAAMDLMLAYEDHDQVFDDAGIPESGNGIPDLLDEARYELDWMLKMQDEETGGVWHKVTCSAFPGEVMPQDETDQLILSPISTTATGDFAAVMAKASVVYRTIDGAFADRALEGALRAWDYIKDSNDLSGFSNPEEIVTGEYPDKGTNDEILWAAAELYLAGRTEVKDALLERFNPYTSPNLGWAQIESYALWDLWKSGTDGAAGEHKTEDAHAATGEDETEGENETTDDEIAGLIEACGQKLVRAADGLVKNAAKDGYYMTLKDNYPWGSNMTVANNGMTLLMASRITGDASYEVLAKRHLDYLLGANALGICFVSGEGTNSPQHPHHRPSQAVGAAMKGMLAGGPDSNLEDPYAKGVLAGQAPSMCYVDSAQSYSTNEVTIYWNSPLIYLLSSFV